MSDLDYKGTGVLITGGLGFIGSNIAHALVERGARVKIVDALIPKLGGNHFNVETIKDKLEIVIGDIRDLELMEKLVADVDVVFNLAAQVDHIASMDDPLLDLDMSGVGALTVLEACRRTGRRIRVVFPGSRLQFGRPKTVPVAEDHPMDPLNIYAVHRLLGETYHSVYGRSMGLSTCVLRLSNPFGPRQQMRNPKYGILNWFIRVAIEGGEITLYGEGTQERDYFFIADAVDAFLRAGSMEAAGGQVFNLGYGEPIKIADAVATIVNVVGSGSVTHIPWPEGRTEQETGGYVTDITKISETLGWSPKIPFPEGVLRTAEYYRANSDNYW